MTRLAAVAVLATVAVLAASCSSPTPPPRTPVARPAAIGAVAPTPAIGEPVVLPPLPAPVAMRTRCATGPARPLHGTKIFDFEPLVVEPVAYGPRVEQQPRDGYVRSGQSIRAAVAQQRDRLEACLRAALGHGLRISRVTDGGGVRASVAFTLTIDPHGLPVDITVSGQAPLAGCVRESLAAIEVARQTARETRVASEITFRDFEHERLARERDRGGVRRPARSLRGRSARLALVLRARDDCMTRRRSRAKVARD